MALSDETTKALDWALGTIKHHASTYALYRDYYAGEQTRMMDDARLARLFGSLFDDFRLNLCQPVVDSLADRLVIAGFGSGDNDDENALEIWKRNRMRRRQGHVHLSAIAAGDAYVIVWPDTEGRATIYPQSPETMAVEYEEDRPGVISRAAKLWSDAEGRDRLTLYYPDRLERFATPPKATPFDSTSGAFDYYTAEGPNGAPIVANPYAVVPVFHFANNADVGELGVSELTNAISVQNALNKQAFDLLTNSEFQAYRQRWATGIEIKKDADGSPINPFVAGPERVWVANSAAETEARFGEFSSADLDPMQNALHTWALFMANTTQTPVHFFQVATNLVSGESQKTAEQKLDAKVTDRQESFGDVWAQAVALAVRMERGLSSDGLELDTNWKDTKPRNEKESWEVAQIKAELGVSKEQILREAGYTEEQINEFRQEDGGPGQAPAQSPLDALLNGSPLRIGE